MIDYSIERKKLEEYILSAAIIENKIVDVLNFLTYKNFTKWDDYDYSEAWSIIVRMYNEQRVIDIMTFSIEYKKQFKKSIFNHIIDLSNRLGSTTNTIHHAAILIQIDMTDKLVELLSQMSMNHNIPELERVDFKNSASELSEYKIDIFDAVNALKLTTESKNYSEISKKNIQKFSDMMNRKCEGIRRNEAKTSIIANMRCLCTSEKAKYLLMQLESEI